jgi:hypothetical protein
LKKHKIQYIKLTSVIYLSFLFFAPSCSSNDFTKAEEVIKKIEQYKKIHARLPISMKEIGLDNNAGPVFYDLLNESHYQLFYAVQSGEIWSYNTLEKKWINCPECASMFDQE